jgi:hypothetical protein
VAGLTLSLHPAATVVSPRTTGSIDVRSADEPGSADASQSAVIEEVRDALETVALDRSGNPTVSAVRERLQQLYRGFVTESSVPLAYAWIWDGREWVFICSGGSDFELDLGSDGDVLIVVRESMLLR